MAEKAVNKRPFDVELDGKVVRLAVVRPTQRAAQEATLVYNRAFREAAERGLMLRARLDRVMRDQNLWDDEKQAELVRVSKALADGEKRLARGGVKLSEARAVMLDMRQAREDLRALLVGRNELDQHTAEAYAEQARFNYLVSACTVYGETGEPYFKGVDDYLAGDDPAAGRAAHEFGRLYYGLDDDFAKKLPENAFGLKYKLLDDDLRLVDRQGRLVDRQGRLVDKGGRLVNERGEPVAADGTPLAEDGSFKVDFVEFEDDLSPARPDADRAAGVSDAVGPPEGVEAFREVAEANSKAPDEMTAAA